MLNLLNIFEQLGFRDGQLAVSVTDILQYFVLHCQRYLCITGSHHFLTALQLARAFKGKMLGSHRLSFKAFDYRAYCLYLELLFFKL